MKPDTNMLFPRSTCGGDLGHADSCRQPPVPATGQKGNEPSQGPDRLRRADRDDHGMIKRRGSPIGFLLSWLIGNAWESVVCFTGLSAVQWLRAWMRG